MSAAATRPNWMEIDLSALESNYGRLSGMLAPGTRIIASVKGNAYGLGMPEVAKRLVACGAHALTTGSFEDAMAIRRAGLDIEIIMFGGTLPEGIPSYIAHDLIPTVHNMALAESVSAAAGGAVRIYVKVDCGLGRLGIPIKDAKASVMAIARLPRIVVEGLYTHLPFTDVEGAAWAQQRLEMFDRFVEDLRRDGLEIPVVQARSSAGILFGLTDRCNAVAPGGLLYGKSPLPAEMVDASAFRPVLKSVRSRLIHITYDAADRTPGLHGRYAFRVKGATGVVPFGRADGNRAALPGHSAYMLVKGMRAPVLGVSSEHAVLDLSDVPDPQIGEEVTILGESGGASISLLDLAAWQGTTGSDILLMLSGRMPRIHIE